VNKKVLIVCYSYPPNPGVGGRKWAIFTKYLIERGFEIHVITKKPLPVSSSPWIEYTNGAILHFFKNPYPLILELEPNGIFDKFRYKIALFITKMLTKSNYYDRGVFSENIIKNEIGRITTKYNIKNVIVTGAPFSFLNYAAELKNKNSSLHYIADIRDSWIKGNYFGFNGLSQKRKNREINKLKSVLRYADHVIVPYKEMQDEYSSFVNRDIVHFPHAVDESLICTRSTTTNSMFTMVCFGSIYDGLGGVFEGINISIKNTNIKIQFYTKDKKYENLIKENVHYCDMVNQIEVFQILSQCNAALFFVNDNIKNYISTKYMEAISSRTPIVLMGKKGLVSDFITNHKLGIFIEENEIEKYFSKIPSLIESLEYNTTFDFKEYTFSYQTDALIKLFI
jgi:hypothetical protein